MQTRSLPEFRNGDSVFAFAVNTQTEFLDKLIFLQRLLYCGTERTGSLAVNDPHGGEISAHGRIQIVIQELGTIMEQGTAVKMILLNNNYLGNVRQWQELFFDQLEKILDLFFH